MKKGSKMSAEGRQKISKAFKGKPWSAARRAAHKDRTGIPMPPGTGAKISAALTGKKMSKQARANMSRAAKNRPPITDATRAKLSRASRGRRMSSTSKQLMSEAASKRGMDVAANEWVYIFRNNTQGTFKAGRTKLPVAERLSQIKTSGHPRGFRLWNKGDDIECIFERRVTFTANAEAQLHEELECYHEITEKSEAEVLQTAAEVCACWEV